MNQNEKLINFFHQNFEQAYKFSENRPIGKHPLKDLKDAHLFITGGTGFFGCWILHLIQWLNSKFDLNIQASILTRNESIFLANHPQFLDIKYFHWLRGDIQTFPYPEGNFTHIIHAATAASVKLNLEEPLLMVDTIINGTRRILDFTKAQKNARLLFVSSGAVYGKQPPELTHLTEEFNGAPNPLSPSSAYGEGKRIAEFLCSSYHHEFDINFVVARCFAFVGPYLPWDQHFAIGNFLKNVVDSNCIKIAGDGTPFRSYLYGADLAIWLFTLLTHGKSGKAYHIGSESNLKISEVAQLVSEVGKEFGHGQSSIQIDKVPGLGWNQERYVPSNQLIRAELGVQENFTLRESLRNSLEFFSEFSS